MRAHTHTLYTTTRLVIDHRILRFPISLISTPISTDLLRFYLAVAGCYRILTRVQRMLMLSFVFNKIQVHTVRCEFPFSVEPSILSRGSIRNFS